MSVKGVTGVFSEVDICCVLQLCRIVCNISWGSGLLPDCTRVGLLSQFRPFHYFPIFSASPKYRLAIEYHVHISQVSPPLSCGDTWQICMWWHESFVANFASGEINERGFNNPFARPMLPWQQLELGGSEQNNFTGTVQDIYKSN